MPTVQFQPRAASYDTGNAYLLALAAKLAYDNPGAIDGGMANHGFAAVEHFDVQATQCFLATSDAAMLLSFRGTEGKIADWMTDLDINLVGGPGGRVHEGFQTALMTVWRQLYRKIHLDRGHRSIWVTGHSLGAALATLCVAKLRLERDQPVDGLYTYGQPRTGDREFARNFNAEFDGRAFRHVHNNDIVARVPFRAMQYSHVGGHRYYDKDKTYRTDISWWDKLLDRIEGRLEDILRPGTDGIKDHAMSHYVECMERQNAAL